MSEIVVIDDKGRVVVPKQMRERAGIKSGSRLLLDVKGPGVIEIRDPAVLLTKAQEIASKKLTGWKEEEHKEDRLALKLARRQA